MGNFMEYLKLTPSMINQFFNTITREGQDQIFFEDVVQVISYLEESKLEQSDKMLTEEGLNLNIIEIEIILMNLPILKKVNSIAELQEQLEEINLMFVDEFEAKHGKGSAPQILNEIQLDFLYKMLKFHATELEGSLTKKLEEKKLNEETDKFNASLQIKEYPNSNFC